MLVMFRGCKCPGGCLSRCICHLTPISVILERTKISQNHSFWPLSAVPGPMLVMFRGCKCPGGCLSWCICHFGLKMIFLDFWPLFPLFLTLFIYVITQNHCVWPVSAVPGPMLVMFRGCKCPGGWLSRCIIQFGLKMIFLDFWPLFPLFLTLFIYAYIYAQGPFGSPAIARRGWWWLGKL